MRDWPETPSRRFTSAVFLDRDGTITEDTHYTHRLEDLAFIHESLEGLKRLSILPLHIIVVSNQAGIALGMYSRPQMSAFNAALRNAVFQSGGRIDAFYYCPDKEPKDLSAGEPPSECAKPAPGLLLEAASDFGLRLDQCFMVGDKTSDIAAGQAVGCFTILLQTGKAGRGEPEIDAVPNARSASLLRAAELLEARVLMARPTAF